MSRRGRTGRSNGDRAQLLLLGAIVLAFTILAVVVLLNSTIYAQSVSTGNTLEDVEDLEAYERTVERDVRELVKQVAGNDSRVSKNAFEDSLESYAERMAERTAHRKPTYVDTKLNETQTESETEIVQGDTEHFESRTGTDTWTLVESVEETTTFELVVDPDPPDPGESSPFTVVVADEDGTEWTIEIEQMGTDEARVIADGEPCDPVTSPAQVDVVEGTVNGSECFEFPPDLEGSYSIEFGNGQSIGDGSSYRLVTDGDVDEDDFYEHTEDDAPYYEEYLTDVSVDLYFESQEVTATRRVEIDVEEVLDRDG